MAQTQNRRNRSNRDPAAAGRKANISTTGTAYAPLLPGAPAGSNMLDIYPCKASSAKACPTFVYLHGGSLVRGDKRFVASMPAFFNQNGVCLVSLNYPVYGRPVEGMIEQQMSAVTAATAWLDSNLEKASPGCSMRSASIMGHSAGAYLAALLLTKPAYARAASSYQSYILNDSAWYTGKTMGRYKEKAKPVFGIEGDLTQQDKVIIQGWIPAELVQKSCPPPAPTKNVLIMYSSQRPERSQEDIRSFAATLNRCSALRASLSAHDFSHREMLTSIGEPGSSTGKALRTYLRF